MDSGDMMTAAASDGQLLSWRAMSAMATPRLRGEGVDSAIGALSTHIAAGGTPSQDTGRFAWRLLCLASVDSTHLLPEDCLRFCRAAQDSGAFVQGDCAQGTRFLPGHLAAEMSPGQRGFLLLEAAGTGNAATVEALLVAGATLGARTPEGLTPLHVAATSEENQVLGILLREGVDMEARDELGNTPLLLACQLQRWRAARVLQDAGADLDAENLQGESPRAVLEMAGIQDD